MALIKCPECGSQMSSEAKACPACGKPSKTAGKREQNSKQAQGCGLMVLGLLMGFIGVVFPPIGILGLVFILVGAVVAALNTRIA